MAVIPEALKLDPAETRRGRFRPRIVHRSPRAASSVDETRVATRDDVRCEEATIARVSLWTVLKVSLLFWVVASTLFFVVASMALSLLASAGVLRDVERFVADAFGLDRFSIDTGKLTRLSLALAVLWTCVATVLTVLGAALYNLYAAIVGGVTVELHCRDHE